MKDKEQTVELEYQALAPCLKRLEAECKFIVEEALHQTGIKTHSVLSRVKTLESAQEKIARKEKAESLSELEDLLGLRIVCLLRSDIARIGKLIRREFKVIVEDNKLDGANIEAFGYQSVHFIAKLHSSYKGRRYDGLHKQVFEIQLRTVAMDAWATLSHYLDYKNEADVPKELRKDFHALSGLFYVADTHFEIFYEGRKKSGASAKKAARNKESNPKEINLDTLTAYLERKYPDRGHVKPSRVSQFLADLIACGYTDFDKIDSALDSAEQAFLQFEKENKPHGKAKRYLDLGAARLSMAIFDPKFCEQTGYKSFERLINYRLKNQHASSAP